MVAVRMDKIVGLDELTGYFKRLAREAKGQMMNHAVDAGASVILEAAKANIRANFEPGTGHLEDSGEVSISNNTRADIAFMAVYAAVHEYGLQRQPITDRQRRFFWAMWNAERDDMWKALALSQTYTIPARPYLRPAVDSHQKAAVEVMAKTLRNEIVKGRPKAVSIRGGGKLNY